MIIFYFGYYFVRLLAKVVGFFLLMFNKEFLVVLWRFELKILAKTLNFGEKLKILGKIFCGLRKSPYLRIRKCN